MVNEPKSHHYVPRFYLERFVDAQGALWVYDKTIDRVFPTGPAGIAAENRFYDFPDATNTEDRLFFEKQFSEIESSTAPIIDSWLIQVRGHKSVEISDADRDVMSLFLTIQLVRTAEARTQTMQFNQGLNRLFPGAGFDDSSYGHFRLLSDANFLNEMADVLASYIWIFANNFSDSAFYTSDNPLIVHSMDSQNWRLGTAAMEQNVTLVLPLSPQTVMYCFELTGREQLQRHDGAVSGLEFTPDKVKHENSGQVGLSRRFVFSNSSDFEFAKLFCSLHPEVTDPNRKRFG